MTKLEKRKEIKRLSGKIDTLSKRLERLQSKPPKDLNDNCTYYLKCFNLALEASFFRTQLGIIQTTTH